MSVTPKKIIDSINFIIYYNLYSIGVKIVHPITIRGLAQGELAKQLGVHPSNISALIKGKQGSVKPERIPALAHALGVTADYLLDPNQTRLSSPPDNRKEAIVNVITAIEVLGWEEVARRIGEAQGKKDNAKADPIDPPMPENAPESAPDGRDSATHKAAPDSRCKNPKNPQRN